MAQDDWSRGRTVRRGGRGGGWIAGSVGGWVDWVRGGERHPRTHLRSSRPEWRDLLGLSGNRGSSTVSKSARRRKTVARFRRARHLLSRPALVPLCRTRRLVARCPHRTSRQFPSRLTTRNDALCGFRALRWRAWPGIGSLCHRADICARNPDNPGNRGMDPNRHLALAGWPRARLCAWACRKWCVGVCPRSSSLPMDAAITEKPVSGMPRLRIEALRVMRAENCEPAAGHSQRRGDSPQHRR